MIWIRESSKVQVRLVNVFLVADAKLTPYKFTKRKKKVHLNLETKGQKPSVKPKHTAAVVLNYTMLSKRLPFTKSHSVQRCDTGK